MRGSAQGLRGEPACTPDRSTGSRGVKRLDFADFERFRHRTQALPCKNEAMPSRWFRTVVGLFAVWIAVSGCASKAKEPGEPAQEPHVAMAVAIGSEKAIDSPAGVYDSSGSSPASATDGTNHLVAWFDPRCFGGCIVGARVGADGTVLDPTGIQIAALPQPDPSALIFAGQLPSYFGLQITFGSGFYLLTWIKDGPTMLGLRVATDGKPIDATPFTIFSDWNQRQLAVLADDSGFGIFYERRKVTGDVEQAWRHLTFPAGVPDLSDRTMPKDPSNATYYGIAYGGGAYMRVVSGFAGGAVTVDMTRFRADGTLIDGAPQTIASTPAPGATGTTPFLVFNGTNFIYVEQPVGWQARVISPAGVASTPVSIPNFLIYGVAPAFGGAVVYGQTFPDGTFSILKLSASAVPGVPRAVAANTTATFAPSATGNVLVWARDGVTVDLLPPDLSSLKTVQLSRAANVQSRPQVAFDGSKYLVAWVDDRGSRPDSASADAAPLQGPAVYAARVSEDGTAEAPFLVSEKGLDPSVTGLRLIFDGQSFFVVWSDTRYGIVRARSIARSGASFDAGSELGATLELISNSMDRLSGEMGLASDGTHRLVVLQSLFNNRAAVRGIRVSNASDQVVDAKPFTIASFAGLQNPNGAAATFDGQRFLVVWSGGGNFLFQQIFGAFVKPGEGNADGSPFQIYSGAGPEYLPNVASDGTNGSLVVWLNTQGDGAFNVLAKRIAKDGSMGQVSEALTLSALGAYSPPVVAYANDKSNFLVAWATRSNDVFGSWVSASGDRVLDPGGVALSEDSRDGEGTPSLAFGSLRRLALAYARSDRASGYGSLRARVRIITSDKESGSPCSANGECATRYCADGICCESACEGSCSTCAATPGQCTAKAAGDACKDGSRFLCDGQSLACRTSCKSSSECAKGYECQTGACIQPEQICLDDFRVGRSVDKDRPGAGTVCANDLKCRGNACLLGCVSADDCREGLVCDFSGTCIAPPEPSNEPGCAAGRSNVSALPWLPFAALLALVRRRRLVRSGKGGTQ